MARKVRPVLIIHGGAWSTLPTAKSAAVCSPSMRSIAEEAYAILADGGTAREAAVKASELLEDHEFYNAGRGSKYQADGRIRMSAGLMDGASLRFSGVVNVQGLRNPIALANRLNKENYRTLSEQGAKQKAKEWGLEFRSAFTEDRYKDFLAAKKGKTGTIGAVALDVHGEIAAATSTGGRGMEWPGRVSDTSTVAGNYANKFVGLSATGTGEHIVDFALCAKIATRVEDGLSVHAAMKKSFAEARRHKFHFGAIALGRDGTYSAMTTTKFLLWAVHTDRALEISL